MITYSIGDKVILTKEKSAINAPDEKLPLEPFECIILSKLVEGGPLMTLPTDRELCKSMGKPFKTTEIVELTGDADESLLVFTKYSTFRIRK
jgi:hypothetical protein